MSLTTAVLLGLATPPTWIASASPARQMRFDEDGARMARGVARDTPRSGGEAAAHVRFLTRSEAARWRRVTSDEMRTRCGGCAPRGYLFKRRATVDLDRDGKVDVIDLVTSGRQDGVRITYGGPVGRVRVIMRSRARRWSDQGLFAAGRHSFLINQPEVNALQVFEDRRGVRVRFLGD